MEKRKIPGYTRYTITKCGRVFGVHGREMKIHKKAYGYPTISIIRDDKKPASVGIHRLVALAWIPNPDNLPIVDHRNGNRADYSISNLRWVTQQQNMESACLDRDQPSLILNRRKVIEIRELLKHGVFPGDIAKKYGVKTQTISKIGRGQSWKNA